MRKTSAILALLMGLAVADAARADVTFCNNWNQPLSIAYGQFQYNSGALCYTPGTQNYAHVRGWYYAVPGQCVSVVLGCNCNWWAHLFNNCPSTDLHFYAEDAFGTWWGGNEFWNTCTPWSAFDQCDDFGQAPCPDGRLLTWGFWDHDQVCNLTLTFTP
jgi:hypothetical protein